MKTGMGGTAARMAGAGPWEIPMRYGDRKGLTLIEVMAMLGVFGIFMVMAYSTIFGVIRVVDVEATVLSMDQQANKVMQGVTSLVRPAILPIRIRPEEKTEKTVFDTMQAAFDGAGGENWRDALQQGTDEVIFIIPADIDGDGDALTNDLAVETGYIDRRGAIVPATDVSLASMANVTPARLAAVTNEAVDWPDIGSTAPARADVMVAIRYVPLTDGGVPVQIREATLRADLDGNNVMTDVFQIGRMQVVYAGPTGNDAYFLNGPMILRRNLPAERAPIFQLVSHQSGDIDANGLINPTKTGGHMILNVRMLFFDDSGQDGSRMTFRGNKAIKALTRWHETAVTLRNMSR